MLAELVAAVDVLAVEATAELLSVLFFIWLLEADPLLPVLPELEAAAEPVDPAVE